MKDCKKDVAMRRSWLAAWQVHFFCSEAATNMSLAPQKLFYQEQEVEQAWARLTDAETRRDNAELQLHHQVKEGTGGERFKGDFAFRGEVSCNGFIPIG